MDFKIKFVLVIAFFALQIVLADQNQTKKPKRTTKKPKKQVLAQKIQVGIYDIKIHNFYRFQAQLDTLNNNGNDSEKLYLEHLNYRNKIKNEKKELFPAVVCTII